MPKGGGGVPVLSSPLARGFELVFESTHSTGTAVANQRVNALSSDMMRNRFAIASGLMSVL